MPDPRSLRAQAAVLGLGLAMLGLGLAGCAAKPPPEGPAPTAIAKADPVISQVSTTPKGLRVVAKVMAPDVAGDTVMAASHAVRQIARAVQNRAVDLPPGATVITVDVYGTDVDKFGGRSFGRMWEADFGVDDLRSFDLKTRGPAAALNTAIDLRVDQPGESPIAAWCMRYPHVAGEYCNMAGD